MLEDPVCIGVNKYPTTAPYHKSDFLNPVYHYPVPSPTIDIMGG